MAQAARAGQREGSFAAAVAAPLMDAVVALADLARST